MYSLPALHSDGKHYIVYTNMPAACREFYREGNERQLRRNYSRSKDYSPLGGEAGDCLVAEGMPDQFAAAEKSATGKCLRS